MNGLTNIQPSFFEETQALRKLSDVNKNQLSIGLPKEIFSFEKRIALTPFSVALLVDNGYHVIIETGAGLGANFTDHEYSEHGALIVGNSEEVYKADLILKIASPTLEEVDKMRTRQVLISSQQPSLLSLEVLKALTLKQVTALSFEYLEDEGGHLSVVRAMSEIVGTTSIHVAVEYLSNAFGGKGLMLGGISGVPPTEIVIIGAGTVGEFAARTAIALGAQVKVFDSSIFRLRRLQNNIGFRVFTSVIQPLILNKAVKSCDVVIGALRSRTGRSSCVISEDTVSEMKPNSVLIDVSIDQGGCFETSEVTTHESPVFRKHDVIHYCVPNIASRVARTATYALTNVFSSILLQIGEVGGVNNLIWHNAGVRNAVYLHQGNLTNKDIAKKFGVSYKDLNLMIVVNQ